MSTFTCTPARKEGHARESRKGELKRSAQRSSCGRSQIVSMSLKSRQVRLEVSTWNIAYGPWTVGNIVKSSTPRSANIEKISVEIACLLSKEVHCHPLRCNTAQTGTPHVAKRDLRLRTHPSQRARNVYDALLLLRVNPLLFLGSKPGESKIE